MILNPSRKPNYTPIAKHFVTARPLSERSVVTPVGRRQPTPIPMLRLSFGALTPKEDRSIIELFRLITRGPLKSTFIFPDASVFQKPMYPDFWRVAAGRNLAFTQMTLAELSGWLSFPSQNAHLHSWLPRALKQCETAPFPTGSPFRFHQAIGSIGHDLIRFTVAVADKTKFGRYGYDHYVKMLSLRKRYGMAAYRDLSRQLGRVPTEQEFQQHLFNQHDRRIAPIALKGWKDSGKRNYLADEELVVTAILTAIASGEEVLILTWDTDIFDQFATLVHMLTADYAAFRYAEVHYRNPDGCPMFPMRIDHDSDRECGFVGDSIHQIVLPEQEMERLWPQSFTPVHVYCVLLGNNLIDPKISTAAFCLEAEMDMLLAVKGKTDGKNTEHFPARNMLVGTSPGDNTYGTLFILGEEKYVNYEGIDVSWVNLHQTLKSDPLVVRKHTFDDRVR